VRRHRANVADSVESALHERSRCPFDVVFRSCDAPRPLDELRDRVLHGELELARADREEERQVRVGESGGIRQISARDAKLGEVGPELSAVPERDAHGVVFGQGADLHAAAWQARGELLLASAIGDVSNGDVVASRSPELGGHPFLVVGRLSRGAAREHEHDERER
jgi:hypothetical protein